VSCLLVLAAACVVGGAVAAAPIVLPSPIALVQPPPPLTTGVVSPIENENELRFPGRIGNTERVVVGLREDGSASAVDVTQRLTLPAAGDYSFVIPAPVLSVVAAQGTQSEPGQRNTGIVWQGFSPGRRVLAALASLEPLAAERGLPLGVKIERHKNSNTVQLIDIARRKVQVTRGSAPVGALQRLVRGVDLALSGDRLLLSRTIQVNGSPEGAGSVAADLPLRVHGTITPQGKAPLPVSFVLGNGQPLTRTLTVPGGGRPKISLEVEALAPRELLPSAAELAAAKDPLRLTELALARIALANQYAQYLASPDQLGTNRTSYAYRSAAPRPERPTLRPADGGESDTVAIVLATVLGAAALGGLAVLWAHS
jgi:hypothetical protein